MANPNFDPQISSNTVWRGDNQERCITDDLDAIEADISDLETSKAPNNHTHEGYAPTNHTHTPSEIGAAAASHSHDYAASAHTHAQSEISGLIAELQAKAEATHNHTLSQIVGLVAALAEKADLVDGKVPESQLPSYVDDVSEYSSRTNFPTTGEADKIYVATDTNKTYRWSGTTYVEIAGGVAIGETSATAYRGDRGKTAYEHSQNGDVHVTAEQKAAWNAKSDFSGSYNDLVDQPTFPTIPSSLPANGGNADTVDGKHASEFSAAGHIHSTTTVTTANEDLNNYNVAGVYSFAASYQPTNRPEGTSNGWLVVIPWTSNANTGTVRQIWLRHGTLGTNDHFMYTRTKIGGTWGTWASVYTSKNPPTAAEVGAATSGHNHDSAYISKSLQFTSDAGGIEKTFYTSDNTNIITEFNALSMGFHTVYSQSGVSGNPNSVESWRFLLHKASSNIMWVMAFGSSGSVYTNYQNGNSGWHGWICIYDASPSALWTGSLYMKENQTVTPSKKLSECRNGWILMWSDYDDDTDTANTFDIVTSIIYKKSISGGNWGGAAHLFEVPTYIGSDSATDTSGEQRVIKRLYVHDDKIVGHIGNSIGQRRDVVLRAVYEF